MSIWSKSLIFFALLLMAAGGVVYWAKFRLIEHGFSDDTSTRQFIIANDVLEIPLNLMRFAVQREKTVLQQADLVMHWSDASGFQSANSDKFLDPAHTMELIFLTIGERQLHLAMNDRVVPIYQKLISAVEQRGPSGLIIRPFKPGAGYDGEELVFASDGNIVWAARCQSAQASQFPTCIRDVFVGAGLTATYRFSRSLLGYWADIETRISLKLDEMVVTGR